ncbi:glycoside hydrolase family 2 TIM barrel-domain containing protein [Dyadobacter sp. SG02]|uniref:glycoside hydrolase family 2 TIM barrel-domain containing protein n=1 Tax=Dyadobacter sp. SG02 TaxID=1855291 RepID=UPI001E46E0AE|nr:glycoside hydrolase family 2 TIM barrel-domain containing protein [Dyadobacter sp. SG02]
MSIRIHSLLLLALTLSMVLSGCSGEKQPNRSAKVHIDQREGRYTLIRNGKPFHIKGAGGYSHFRELHEAGGNTLRTWDTTQLAQILDSAQKYELAVIVGLPLPNSGDISFYNDPQITQTRYRALQSLIKRFKNHPAVLMWCLGNELDFPYKWTYSDFYDSFNALTDMIHREDPDHPVTTTVLNFNPKYIFNIGLRCDVDLISFNIFSNLPLLRKDLDDLAWLWKGPYMLLEWGINGPWQGTQQTAWGAYIEDTSKKKAEIYQQSYRQFMPLNDPRFLGACVFFWGNKQETTHTWFSIFDEYGNVSETVGAMRGIWTGKPTPVIYPEIKYMLLNTQGARDNILLNPSANASAEVLLFKGHDRIRSVRWQIFQEDWYRENHLNSTRKLVPLATAESDGRNLRFSFAAPKQEGPYRIFATIYDNAGNFASCNTPFYVVSPP